MHQTLAEKVESAPFLKRISANQAMWGGIAFSTVFTILIWAFDYRLDAIELLPDQGAAWYKWKI